MPKDARTKSRETCRSSCRRPYADLIACGAKTVDAVPKLIDSLIDSHGDSIISSTWPAEQLKATLQQVLDG